MKTFTHTLSLLAVLAAMFFCSSCSDKMYVQAPCSLNELNINGSLAQELGILNAEANLSANTETGSIDLSINYGTGDNYRVQLYTSNPEENEESYLLAYYILSDESTTELLCNLPENISNLYVGVIDAEGRRVVKSVAMLNGRASASFGTLMASSK